MLQFILGTIFGGFVAFVIIVIICINKTDDKNCIPQHSDKDINNKGEENEKA